MAEYKTDEEKVEELKAWWKENGMAVIAGVGLAIAALFGWEYWQKHQQATAASASALYAKAEKAVQSGVEQALPDIKALQDNYAATPYATLASLKLAQYYAEKGEYEPARTALQWALEHGKDDDLKTVAKLRLARVLLAMQKPQEAWALLEATYPTAYQGLVEELKGDVYVAQNKPAEARAAYDKALLGVQGGAAEFIRMKRDNLGEG